MNSGSGTSVADEWMLIARKDWRRAERNLKDSGIALIGVSKLTTTVVAGRESREVRF